MVLIDIKMIMNDLWFFHAKLIFPGALFVMVRSRLSNYRKYETFKLNKI